MTENRDKDSHVGFSYALAQIRRVLRHGSELALVRAEKWRNFLEQVSDGRIEVGSRSPVKGVPPWVTPEVLHGGFASGDLAASGPLLPHEIRLLERVEGESRLDLNLHFTSPEGLNELETLLTSRCYRISVPEEAGLLVVAWLFRRGDSKAAEQLLATLAPFYDRLRFYPRPASTPLRTDPGVHVASVSEVSAALRQQHPQRHVAAQKESIRVWAPLEDRAVDLFCETVEGELPSLVRTLRDDGSAPTDSVVGGWPCRQFPDSFKDRAQALLRAYEEARKVHSLCKKVERPKENFARLRGYLAICMKNSSQLSGRDVGWIRRVLASHLSRRGRPNSPERTAHRARQNDDVRGPSYIELANQLAEILSEVYAPDEGAPDLLERMPPDTPFSLQRKAKRCWQAPVESLVDHGVLGSSEALAGVISQMTASVFADTMEDTELAALYQALYLAFRKRRSLLLLNYRRQVQFEELPMTAALNRWLNMEHSRRTAPDTVLKQLAALVVTQFPQTALPNKMVTELRALSVAAGRDLPFLEELAADIFMGGFSSKFFEAAQIASDLLLDTPYARYYQLPYSQVRNWNEKALGKWAKERIQGDWSYVARNGAIIEQVQILTTHNLATLLGPLGLLDSLRPSFVDLSKRCFDHICLSMARPIPDWRAQMQTVKNAAYAWRQMVLFLTFCTEQERQDWQAYAHAKLGAFDAGFQQRFAPAMVGLEAALAGRPVEPEGRVFLGWSPTRHWLLAPEVPES